MDERLASAAAPRRGAALSRLARLIDAGWYRRSVRSSS
jgi:hypothetical protein